MTNRQIARLNRDRAKWRETNADKIGQKFTFGGGMLEVGFEFETPDGFRVRVVKCEENKAETGHFIGQYLCIGFAADRLD